MICSTCSTGSEPRSTKGPRHLGGNGRGGMLLAKDEKRLNYWLKMKTVSILITNFLVNFAGICRFRSSSSARSASILSCSLNLRIPSWPTPQRNIPTQRSPLPATNRHPRAIAWTPHRVPVCASIRLHPRPPHQPEGRFRYDYFEKETCFTLRHGGASTARPAASPDGQCADAC